MRAITRSRYGDADVLRLEAVPTPVADDDEVLLEVNAAGLDRGAWHLMTGRPTLQRLVTGLRRPRNRRFGREVAGTVVAIGSAVTRFAPGDRVFGIGDGTFAEYATAPENKLCHLPAGISSAQAATLPVSGLTALQSVCTTGQVAAGQQVLILGASGGVGSIAVQLAKAHGAEVTAVCSAEKEDFVRSLGAGQVIDYARYSFGDGPRRYDLIIDLAGNPPLGELRSALTARGTAVITGGEHAGAVTGGIGRQLRGVALSPFLRQRLAACLARENAEDLGRFAALVDAGALRPCLDTTYPLDRVADAVRHLESGRVRGKVAITT